MVGPRHPARRYALRGASMIEVLVTMVIIAFGLLGMAGLQMRLQSSEVEAYQRTQALLLLDDLRSRLEANRLEAASYAEEATLAAPVGAGPACLVTGATSTRAELDVRDWCEALKGAAESAGGSKVGAMIGGRGCVENLGLGAAGDQVYRIQVAWQGLTPTAAPVEACGAGAYNGTTGSKCQNDLCRRVVSTVIRIANLN